jgi:hypothetical protein
MKFFKYGLDGRLYLYGDSTIVMGCDVAEQGIVDGGLGYYQYDRNLRESSSCTYDPKTKQFKSITILTDHSDMKPEYDRTFPWLYATINNKTPYSICSGENCVLPHTSGRLVLNSHSSYLAVEIDNNGHRVSWIVSCNDLDNGIFQTSNPNEIDSRFGAVLKCDTLDPVNHLFAESIEIVDLSGK